MGNIKKSERLTKQELVGKIAELREKAKRCVRYGHRQEASIYHGAAYYMEKHLLKGYKGGHEPDESDINYNYKIRGFPLGVLVQIAQIMASQNKDALKIWEDVDYYDQMTLHDFEGWQKSFKEIDKEIARKKKKDARRSSKR